jgi:DNA polymerase III subunit delta'
MSLNPLVGHEVHARQVLTAIAEDRLPQMVLLTGKQGVGKQRFGLWMAQALLCEAGARRPCGTCWSCTQVLKLTHPDLHWLVPVLRPKAADPDKAVEELADAVGALIEERRQKPLWSAPEGMAGHFVATARLLQRRAALTPVVARKKVFLLAEADRLVPQEASQEAANALLKLLEEPPADTQLILTVVDPNRLLPTVRSRLVPLRLGRLSDEQVEGFLGRYAGLAGTELRGRVARAGGSIGQALAAGEESAKSARAADELLKAVLSGPAVRAERALKQGPWAARGEFTAMLDSLAEVLGEAARAASGQPAGGPLPEGLRSPRPVQALVAAQTRVLAAREAAQGNVNPQLLLAVLAEDLAEVL